MNCWKVICLVFLISCSNTKEKNQAAISASEMPKNANPQAALIEYMTNCKTLQLPITIAGGSTGIFANDSLTVPETDIHMYNGGKFRKLFENDSMYLMLFWFPAGAGGLTLETLGKNGHRIESLPATYKYDNVDPSFIAIESVAISTDLTIIATDSLISYKVDENEIPILSTKSTKVEISRYKVFDNGHIRKMQYSSQ